MYPSLEHRVRPNSQAETVVEARVINNMKSHPSEDESWRVIDHLSLVDIQKGKISAPFGKRLPKGWGPARHYRAQEVAEAIEGDAK
jgi:hypothetical protein